MKITIVGAAGMVAGPLRHPERPDQLVIDSPEYVPQHRRGQQTRARNTRRTGSM